MRTSLGTSNLLGVIFSFTENPSFAVAPDEKGAYATGATGRHDAPPNSADSRLNSLLIRPHSQTDYAALAAIGAYLWKK
jgi:hypothetical protein